MLINELNIRVRDVEGLKRAAVVLVEDNKHLLLQLGCLYTSLKYMKSDDTDLVVFAQRNALQKNIFRLYKNRV